jgi:peptidoglycan/LPS O-acetylase OafA/YrhL
LDALRGVAALMVATMHLSWPGGVFAHSYLAVDFFFVLSGFVIAEAYEDRLKGGMRFGDFAWRRLVRLWPLFVLAVGLGLSHKLLRAVSGVQGIPLGDLTLNAAFNSLMLPSPITDRWTNLYPANSPAWSLLYELVANAVYGLVATRLSTRWLAAIVAVSGAALVWACLNHGTMNFGVSNLQVGGGLIRVAFGFSTGVLIYRVARPKIRRVSLLPLLFAAILGVCLAFGTLSDLVFVFVVTPLIVVLGARFEPPRWLAGAAVWMGAISYGVYVLHIPLKDWALTVLEAITPHTPGLAIRATWCVLAAVVFTTVADKVWDVPIRRWLAAVKWRGGAAAAPKTESA